MKKWLQICYSAMMYREKKKKPKDWVERIAFILNFNIFFVFSAIVFNVMLLVFGTGNYYDRIILFLIAGTVAYFSFKLNDKNMKKYILKNDLPKTYSRKSEKIDFMNLILVIVVSFSMFLFFIFSFKMQNYF